jgi:hypothetical protein
MDRSGGYGEAGIRGAGRHKSGGFCGVLTAKPPDWVERQLIEGIQNTPAIEQKGLSLTFLYTGSITTASSNIWQLLSE